jgi:cytochrome o ubiquinol oxidase subunit 3
MTTALAAIHAGHAEAGANKPFGFWIYLMSDLVLFAALFATFAVLSQSYAGGPTGRELFHLPRVFAETMLLLTSSASYGMVMLAVRADRARAVLFWLALTFVLGAGFVGLEITEFRAMILAGDGPDRSAFLSAFFTLVGTHGTHVSFGLVWMAVMLLQVRVKGLTAPVRTRLLCLGMFWHFLDIVWIGVFSVVYLLGVIA